ncbi:MAG: DUF2851 family protein [Mucinivorans sp.]
MIDKDFLKLIWCNRLFGACDLSFSDSVARSVTSLGRATDDDEYRFTGIELFDPKSGSVVCGTACFDALSSELSDTNRDITLHIVGSRDKVIINGRQEILTLTITPAPPLGELYVRMPIDCPQWFASIGPLAREAVIERLVSNRIERKGREIISLAREFDSWSEAFYISFLRSWGYKDKKRDFENLARALPYQYIVRHTHREHLVEAMMLGVAGYLDCENPDFYTADLQSEWQAFRHENSIGEPIIDWRSFHTRPSSAPAISIVRAATILTRTPNLAREILDCHTKADLYALFDVQLPSYWRYYHAPSTPIRGQAASDTMSVQKLNLVIINFVVPFIWAYGTANHRDDLITRSLDILNLLEGENNMYTRLYFQAGFCVRTATDSQALIELRTLYCSGGLCARCPVGAYRLLLAWRQGVL